MPNTPAQFGSWQSWDAPVFDWDIGRQVEVQLRAGGDASGVIIASSSAPHAKVRLADGRVIRLHDDCEGYRLGAAAAVQADRVAA